MALAHDKEDMIPSTIENEVKPIAPYGGQLVNWLIGDAERAIW